MVMKTKFITSISLLAAITALTGCPKKDTATSAGDLKTEIEKVSYILGYSTGKSFSEQSVDVDINLFQRGMKDGLSKEEKAPVLTEEQMREVMQNFRTTLMEKRKKETEEASGKNQKAGEEFLAKNKIKPGVITLPSGLQYKVITEGKGDKPGPNDSVTVDYTGTLLSGKTFDSTKTRGKPATFPVGTTIPGMSEALKLMSTGSTWEIYIPSTLGYGAQGAGATIGPNEVLTFKLQLISVEKAAAIEAPKEANKAPVKN
jgi:FKBP-type peptidyl-prolyl cis-trans isomerase FklB